jgi:hypothetical protein
MCDYSLCGLPTRLAMEGEELVLHKFPTGSKGLASPADLIEREPVRTPMAQGLWKRIRSLFEPSRQAISVRAICIPPGAELILRDIPPDLLRNACLAREEPVTFTQISADVNNYRDAVRFRNGCQIRLQELREGMRVKVLSLGGGVEEYTEAMAHTVLH